MDWRAILLPSTPPLEIIFRGSVVYIALFVLLRVVLKRQSGTVGISDLLLIVLIADASQNAIADDYRSIPDGLLLVTTLIGWNYFLDWLGFRFAAFQRLITPPALPLVRDGRPLWRNMRKELITEDELMSQLRRQGIASFEEVRLALMEPDGRISVVPYSPGTAKGDADRASGGVRGANGS